MTNDGTFEVKNRCCELGERAARGQENVNTQHGERVAGLTPARAPRALDPVSRLATRIRKSRDERPLGDGISLRDMIEEGRR